MLRLYLLQPMQARPGCTKMGLCILLLPSVCMLTHMYARVYLKPRETVKGADTLPSRMFRFLFTGVRENSGLREAALSHLFDFGHEYLRT